ncbi:hypothetical protein [Prochlorococcus marinus]|uniref:hypothetical protein n=1 Tax=Prochlorococcus marinus TaxID=1219 RepID=UPI0012FED78C|nr:hypothetical protein [Prochlorococcus marinus]
MPSILEKTWCIKTHSQTLLHQGAIKTTSNPKMAMPYHFKQKQNRKTSGLFLIDSMQKTKAAKEQIRSIQQRY